MATQDLNAIFDMCEKKNTSTTETPSLTTSKKPVSEYKQRRINAVHGFVKKTDGLNKVATTEEIGALSQVLDEYPETCLVCEKKCSKSDIMYLGKKALGHVHSHCMEIMEEALSKREQNVNDKKIERTSRKRFEEVQLMVDTAYGEIQAQDFWYNPPTIPENNSDVPVCCITGEPVNTEDVYGVLAGTHNGNVVYAGRKALRMEILKDDSMKTLLNYETYGLKLSEDDMKEIAFLWAFTKRAGERHSRKNLNKFIAEPEILEIVPSQLQPTHKMTADTRTPSDDNPDEFTDEEFFESTQRYNRVFNGEEPKKSKKSKKRKKYKLTPMNG